MVEHLKSLTTIPSVIDHRPISKIDQTKYCQNVECTAPHFSAYLGF